MDRDEIVPTVIVSMQTQIVIVRTHPRIEIVKTHPQPVIMMMHSQTVIVRMHSQIVIVRTQIRHNFSSHGRFTTLEMNFTFHLSLIQHKL